MNKRFPLTAVERKDLGHSARKLKRSGAFAATVYGEGRTSLSLSVAVQDFVDVYKQAGDTHIIDLSVSGKTHPVLVKSVQTHPVSNQIHHVEFYVVNLKEKLKTSVPVSVIGESPAVQDGKGIIITTLQEIEIETLPTNIPESMHVDVSSLTDVDQEIKVSQVSAPSGVTILSDSELTVVKVGAIVVEEEKPSAPEQEQPTTDGAEQTSPAEEAKAE